MNYEIYIENLGAIEEADITITPLTILAGENGTGKSFVTKFLYSVLSTINVDIYSNYTVRAINRISNIFEEVINFFKENECNLKNIEDLDYLERFQSNLKDISDFINKGESDYCELDEKIVVQLQSYSENYIENILPRLKSCIEEILSQPENKSSKGLFGLSFKFLGGLRTPRTLLDRTPQLLNELTDLLQRPQFSYLKILSEYITDELKENFQISEIQHLINYSANDSIFKIKDLVEVHINREKGLSVEILSDYLSGFERINHILFFESPVYWRLLPIIDNLDRPKYKSLNNMKGYEVLTGIPKHFYDLKNLLFTNFKEGERPQFIRDCADDLEKHLKGSFKSSEADLTFENSVGQSIPKNLVSFGMTNIGIIQAVLSRNIVNIGSFIFIDEPESNLHPEWQSVLSQVLVKLASNHVNIIITTHSSDMLKALEVNAENKDDFELGNLISTSYFEGDGKLLNLEGNSPFEKIASARAELLKPYSALSIKKSLFND